MYYLNNFLKIFYLCFCCLFFFFLVISFFFDLNIWNIFFLTYLIIVFPLLEKVFFTLTKDFYIWNLEFRWLNILKYILLFLIFILSFFVLKISFLNAVFIWFFAFTLFFLLDFRISIFFWTSLWIFVPILAFIGNYEVLNIFVIFMNYFFVTWILTFILKKLIFKYENVK